MKTWQNGGRVIIGVQDGTNLNIHELTVSILATLVTFGVNFELDKYPKSCHKLIITSSCTLRLITGEDKMLPYNR